VSTHIEEHAAVEALHLRRSCLLDDPDCEYGLAAKMLASIGAAATAAAAPTTTTTTTTNTTTTTARLLRIGSFKE
jgi:hypothetical protein